MEGFREFRVLWRAFPPMDYGIEDEGCRIEDSRLGIRELGFIFR